MRTIRTTLTALSLAALIASPAFAQGRGRGGFGMGQGFLLSNKSVQEELKLDEKQVEEANKVAANNRTKMGEIREALQGLEGQELRDKRTELMKPITEENEKAIAGILKPEQAKRYKEITLQTRGIQAFASPELQTELNLSDEQKEKIKAIQAEYAPGRGGRGGNNGGGNNGDFAAAMERMRARRKESLDKVMAVLNDDQKKTWKEKTGAPFEMKIEPRQNNN